LVHCLALCAVAFVLAASAGCGGTARPEIGPIEFTNASGTSQPAVSAVEVNGQLYLVAVVTNDDQLLGVSWTVSCGSALPPSSGVIDTSCGTLSPAQTLSGPVPSYPSTGYVTTYSAPQAIPKGGTITITAHATALFSVSSSVTLTIEAAQSGANVSARPDPDKTDRVAYQTRQDEMGRARGRASRLGI
jgi:hypothetical protein